MAMCLWMRLRRYVYFRMNPPANDNGGPISS